MHQPPARHLSTNRPPATERGTCPVDAPPAGSGTDKRVVLLAVGVLVLGLTTLVVVLLLVNWSHAKRGRAAVAVCNSLLDEAVTDAEKQAEQFHHEEAIAALQTVSESIRSNADLAYADWPLRDALEQRAAEQLARRKAAKEEYDARIAHGYVVLEGKLMRGQDRDRILGERAREEGARRVWRPGVPLTRRGTRLIYDGRPFSAVGVNKHELLDLYLGPSPEATGGSEAAKASLRLLTDIGVTVIRVRMNKFWSAKMEQTFLSTDPRGREAAWKRVDAMLDDCDTAGVRVVANITWDTFMWSDLAHESLRDLYGNRESASRKAFRDWILELVARYHDRDTILFWELTNEANLVADLWHPLDKSGVVPYRHTDESLYRAPVVRDEQNNFTSDELAGLCGELADMIKSLDSKHMVGTGFSAPRPAAWHLRESLRTYAASGIWKGDGWTLDSPEEQTRYLRLVTPPSIDLISLHFYGGHEDTIERMCNLKHAADLVGKSVYIGEFGMDNLGGEATYDNPKAVQGLRMMLDAFRLLDVPLALAWTWDEATSIHEPSIRPARHQEVVKLLQEANRAAGESGSLSQGSKKRNARLLELGKELQELLPPKQEAKAP